MGVTAVAKPTGDVALRHAVHAADQCLLECLAGPPCVAAEGRLELGPAGLDGAEVRGVGRQVQDLRARCLDALSDTGDLVGAKVVEDYADRLFERDAFQRSLSEPERDLRLV